MTHALRARRIGCGAAVCTAGIGLAVLAACGGNPRPVPMTSGAVPPPADRGWSRVVFLDFGRRDQRASGAMAVSRTFLYYELGWVGGMTRNGSSDALLDPYLRDYIEGEDAELVLGVRPAPVYRFILSLGDPDHPRGPFAVSANGRPCGADVTTRAGEVTELRGDVAAPGGTIRFRFAGKSCGSFAIAGMALYAAPGASPPGGAGAVLQPIYRRGLPVPASFGREAPGPDRAETARRLLRQAADHLLAQEPAEGGFAYSGNWYENAFPVRTLLAAYRVLGTDQYRDAAFRVLDRFVSEQGANGGWSSQYFGKVGCPAARAAAASRYSTNLADIGSMVEALAFGGFRAVGERRSRYLSAAARYADRVSLPNQFPSGGFPNRVYRGVDYRGIYSVATATQAGILALLYTQTGDRRYLEASEQAATLLAGDCLDGKIVFHPHDKAEPDTLTASRMGELFYLAEGLLIAARYAEPPHRGVIEAGIHRLLGGERGIFRQVGDDGWWAFTEPWEQAKRAGLLYLWDLYIQLPGSPSFESGPGPRLLGCLADPDCAGWFGVGTLPHAPEGKYALVSTGLAGIGLAGAADPGGMLPPPSGVVEAR